MTCIFLLQHSIHFLHFVYLVFLKIFFRYFLQLHFKCYPKSPLYPPPTTPLPTHSHFLTLVFPRTGAYKVCKTKGPLFPIWPTRPSFATYAARNTSSGVLVCSYCCSTYRVADPFYLDTFSSSSIGGPVFHPIDDCEHLLLYLPGTGIASHETAISGSFRKILLTYE